MIKKLLGILKTEKMRYLIVGGLTTLVNLGCFHFLVDVLHWDVMAGNIISVIVAILFAFITNKLIVFGSHAHSAPVVFSEFIKFVGGRMITMIIEVGGVYVLHNLIGIYPMPSKIATQVIVVILNYFISKYFVFKK